MTNQEDAEKLISIYQRRLQKLQEQRALYGALTNPAILIEIEDIEANISDLRKASAPLKLSSQEFYIGSYFYINPWKTNSLYKQITSGLESIPGIGGQITVINEYIESNNSQIPIISPKDNITLADDTMCIFKGDFRIHVDGVDPSDEAKIIYAILHASIMHLGAGIGDYQKDQPIICYLISNDIDVNTNTPLAKIPIFPDFIVPNQRFHAYAINEHINAKILGTYANEATGKFLNPIYGWINR